MVQVFKDFLVYIIGDIQLTNSCSIMDIVAISSVLMLVSMLILPCFKIFKNEGVNKK